VILDAERQSSDDPSGLVSHITGEVLSACRESMTLEIGDIHEVAKAVESFVAEQPNVSGG
jgi:hypothetical protein